MSEICPSIQKVETTAIELQPMKSINITPNQTCVLCEFVIHLLQQFASANSSAQELAQILENVCTLLPTVLQSECKTFVDTYGFDIVAILAREFDPKKVCTTIKVCPKSNDVSFLNTPDEHACGLCDYVSKYLEAGFSKEDVCIIFSPQPELKQKCDTLVQIYRPNLCKQLRLCQSTVMITPSETNIRSAECSLCKYVVSYLDNVLQNNRSEAAIEAALEKVCSILPEPLQDKCKEFVTTYGAILAQLLAKYATPDQVCNALKVCNNGTQLNQGNRSRYMKRHI